MNFSTRKVRILVFYDARYLRLRYLHYRPCSVFYKQFDPICGYPRSFLPKQESKSALECLENS